MMSKKWSSYKDAQLMTENWRRYLGEEERARDEYEEGIRQASHEELEQWRRWIYKAADPRHKEDIERGLWPSIPEELGFELASRSVGRYGNGAENAANWLYGEPVPDYVLEFIHKWMEAFSDHPFYLAKIPEREVG
jgi:hypothetical protein